MEQDRRPWGSYQVLADEEDHKVKRIVVSPGKRLSLQRHRLRAEHWFVVRGEGLVTLDHREIPVRPGAAADIPCGALHRIRNTGREALVFIEIQIGISFREDDIERVADDFGRV